MPLYALPPSEDLPTTLRSLRRSLGFPVYPTTAETLPDSATHVLLPTLRPSLALCAALVDPALALVHLDNKHYRLPRSTLPSHPSLAWAGTVNLCARAVWSETGLALDGIRLCVMAALRPRNAGPAAPSTHVVRLLAKRAGAILTDDTPDLVLVAPGSSKRGARVRTFLENGVLCLGAGFILDLLLRVCADPTEYLAFEEQRQLCGPVLNEKVAHGGRPLPIAKPLLEKQTSAQKVSDGPTFAKSDPRRCADSQPTANDDAEERAQKRRKVSRSAKRRPGNSNLLVHGLSKQAKEGTRENITESNAPQKRKTRKVSESHDGAFEHSPSSISAAPQHSPSCVDHSPDCVDHSSETRGVSTAVAKSASLFLARCDAAASPLTPAERPLRRSEPENHSYQSSFTRSDRYRSNPRSINAGLDDRTLPVSGTLDGYHHEEVIEKDSTTVDIYSERIDLTSSSAKSRGKLKRSGFSLEGGFQFFISCLGKPKPCDVQLLLRSLSTDEKNERGHTDDEDHNRRSASEGEENSAGGSCPSHLIARKKGSVIDFGVALPMTENLGGIPKRCYEEIGRPVQPLCVSQEQRTSKPDPHNCDPLQITIPQNEILLSWLHRPEIVLLEYANDCATLRGHPGDDQTCQDSVTCSDWILGAENYLGVTSDYVLRAQSDDCMTKCRKLWSTLFESEALKRIANINSFSEREAKTLTTICIRLLCFQAGVDERKSLAELLLHLRDKQEQMGFDSLQTVLGARDLETISARHKAIATLWATLLRTDSTGGNLSAGIEVFNSAICSNFSRFIDTSKAAGAQKPSQQLKKELLNVLHNAVLVNYACRIRIFSGHNDTKLLLGPGAEDVSSDNWSPIRACMDILRKNSNLLSSEMLEVNSLEPFLRKIVMHGSRRAWPITEELISSTSKLIAASASRAKSNCFCDTLSKIPFEALSRNESTEERAKLFSLLKTPCDCLLYLGWLYSSQGRGHPMKRAISVIRSISAFSCGDASHAVSAQSVRHHIGVVLTMGDCIASSRKDGEYLLCKMLTSKYQRMELRTVRQPSQALDRDRGWRAVLRAISHRCNYLLARNKSAVVYIEWLYEKLSEAIILLRKMSNRRVLDMAEREAMRAQDPICCNICISIIDILTETNRRMMAIALDDNATAQDMGGECRQAAEIRMTECTRFCVDVLSEVRSKPEQSVGKGRHELLRSLVSLLESKMSLFVHVWKLERRQEQDGSSGRGGLVSSRDLDEKVYGNGGDLEVLLINIGGGGQLAGEQAIASEIRRAASGMLADLIELRRWHGSRKNEWERGDIESVMSLLQRCNMNVCDADENRCSVKTSSLEWDEVRSNRWRLRFWCLAVRCDWIHTLLSSDMEKKMERMCISGMIVFLSCMADDWSMEDRKRAREFAVSLANVDEMKGFFELMQEEVEDMRERTSEGDEWGSSKFVERALRVGRDRWKREDTQRILRVLDERVVQGGLRNSKRGDESLVLYSFTHALWGQLEGFKSGRWVHRALSEIGQAVGRIREWGEENGKQRSHMVQRRVLSMICMTEGDMETRVLVVRAMNGFGGEDGLSGMWGGTLLGNGGTRTAAWVRRAERQAQEWREFVFGAMVEDALFGGGGGGGGRGERRRNVWGAVKRLVAAGHCGNEKTRGLVGGVIARGSGKLDEMLQEDGRAWRAWTALREEFG